MHLLLLCAFGQVGSFQEYLPRVVLGVFRLPAGEAYLFQQGERGTTEDMADWKKKITIIKGDH